MSRLIQDLQSTTPVMLAVWDDDRVIAHALAFEAALARAEAAEGLIPPDAAEAIAAACGALDIDAETLAKEAAHAGTLAIPLVARLRQAVAGAAPDAARFVHFGSTSQDLADTVMMLQLRQALALIEPDLARLTQALAAQATTHRSTPMCGRTLLQPAMATTFGLKAAHWRAGLRDAGARIRREAEAAVRLQFGGAAGTRAGLSDRGAAVSARLAEQLGLADALPWQVRRGGVAGLASSLAILTGEAGRMAGDLALLSQPEIAEAFEPRLPGRGGSSAMSHKRNPTGCRIAISAALRAPHLSATIASGQLHQQHERGLGGWQAEAPVMAELSMLAHGAVVAMSEVAQGLEVDTARMARNLDAAGLSPDTGEATALVDALLADTGAD